jgi:glutathione gamma-glutamylcysteinyltransferase
MPAHDDAEDIRDALHEKHCQTCTCGDDSERHSRADRYSDSTTTTTTNACGHEQDEPEAELPPPLPEPTYSVHKRVLPEHLIALSSPHGKTMLLDALQHKTAESYWNLMNHFCNQSDPAYCGVTTLLICLNSMSVDPNVRWRGGWRYYGEEDTILQRCCIPKERIQRAGITITEFARLAKCQGLQVTTKQPIDRNTVNEFRQDVKEILSKEDGLIVASFSRSALGQTGEGHFSPIAAYHEETDSVLVLDVARFKYSPYWVSISELHDAMKPWDETSHQSRGWFILYPPANVANQTRSEARRPAHLVPETKESDICPIGKVKVHYCEASKPKSQM